MSVSSATNCAICQNHLVTSGIFYPIANLIPSRQVRKLDGCNHEIHTACFQNWVNKELATNIDHKGPVSCPSCPVQTNGVHSAQEFLDVVPSPFMIDYVVSIISGGLQGAGLGSLFPCIW